MNWKKILLTVILGTIVVFGAIFAYMILTTRNHSPADTAIYKGSGLEVTVNYCRPYKKGRLVFGEKSEGALQPYGKYWRVGANEATEIQFSQDVAIMDKTLKAGTYVLYAIPGTPKWTIGFNTDLGRWGYSEVDYEKDVMQVSAPQQQVPEVVEQFTIDFTEQEQGVVLNLKWDQTLVPITIRPL